MNTHHSILLYGLSSSGKTSLLGQLLDHLLPEGKKARLYTCEHYDNLNEYRENGKLEVWKVNTRAHPFETARKAIRGFWPARDVELGLADSSADLVAPRDGWWMDYPIRLYEGIGTWAEYISSNHFEGGLLNKAGKNEVMGPVQEHIQFEDGAEGIGGLCWTHYRIGQMEMLGLVQASMKHPGLVVWSSHEDDGKEGGVPFRGPQVFGSKMTGIIGKEFDELYHLATVPVDYEDPKSKELRRYNERRLYIKEHYVPGGSLPYKAKNSFPLKKQKEVPDYISLSEFGIPKEDNAARIVKWWN